MPKFPKTKEDQLENIVEKWCYFFKYASETSEKDLKKIVGDDVVIGQAYDQLVKYNWTDDERALYEWIEKNENDNVSCLNQKFNEGKKEGIQIGKERGIQIGHGKGREEGILIGEERGIQIGHEKGEMKAKIAVAKNLLKAGVSVDLIAESTSLSLDEIEQLKEEVTS
ncbi:MAG: hypothetical protein ACR5K9_02855 [Wolbachia sp.]